VRSGVSRRQFSGVNDEVGRVQQPYARGLIFGHVLLTPLDRFLGGFNPAAPFSQTITGSGYFASRPKAACTRPVGMPIG
jgi:hypothetical protein